jgi:integral membrane protein
MKNVQSDISAIRNLRYVGIAEGISYLVLLFIAMPIKYMAGINEVVKYTGWAHGVLFMLFLPLVAWVKFKLNWSYGWAIWAFIASLLPFGTFILDRQLKKDEVLLAQGAVKEELV